MDDTGVMDASRSLVMESSSDATARQAPLPDDEASLIARSRAGATDAFTALVRMHQARVRAYLAAYLRRPELVDDLAQDVFLSAFRDLKHFGRESSFRVWVLGIARHRALNHVRDDRRRRAREHRSMEDWLGDWRSEALEADADVGERDRMLSALKGCIDKLPQDSQALVTDFYFRRLSVADLAQQRHKNEGALRMTILRIRQALRACVEKTLAGQGA